MNIIWQQYTQTPFTLTLNDALNITALPMNEIPPVEGFTHTDQMDNLIKLARVVVPYRNSLVFIKKSTLESIFAYVQYGVRGGDFMTCLMRNELDTTIAYADSQNLLDIKAICSFVYCHTPAACHGSDKAVKSWIEEQSKIYFEHIDKGIFGYPWVGDYL